MMRLAPCLVLLVACGDSSAPSQANPPRLYLTLHGPEVAGMVQLIPVLPAPF